MNSRSDPRKEEMPTRNVGFLSDLLIESIFVFLIVFSPLIYASVTILPLSIIEISGFFLLVPFVVKILFGGPKEAMAKIPLFSLLLFIILVLFQLIALPGNLLSFLSPGTSQSYVDFGFTSMNKSTLSIYPEATVSMLLQCLSYLAIFFVAVNYFDSGRKIKRIILVIIISGFIYSLYGIIRRFAVTGPGFSTFINRNHFSAYIQMIIPLSIGFSLTKASLSARSIFIFLASTMLLALFLALSRAGIICFALSLLILLIILRIKYSVKKEISLIIAVVLLLSLLMGIVSGFDLTLQRLKTLSSLPQVYAGRMNLIKDTLKIIKDFPFWGTGLGTLGEIFQKYKSLEGGETFSFAHNELLQLIAETGLLGFLLIIVFLVTYFKNVLGLLFKRRNPYVIYLSLGCLIGIASIFLHSMFDFVFHIPANAVLFVIILALISRIVRIREAETVTEQKLELNLPIYLKVIFTVILSLSFLSEASLVLRRYKAERIFQVIKENKIGDTGLGAIFKYRKALKEMDKAIDLAPLNSAYYNKKADILSELSMREDLKNELSSFEEFGSNQKLLFLAGEFYKKAIELNPFKADYHLRLGWLYGAVGEKELSGREFNNAILLDPWNTKIKAYVNDYLNSSIK